MRIFRATNPSVVDFLRGKLLEDSDYLDPEVEIEGLRSSLADFGQQTLVLLAVEGEELEGFIIAMAPQWAKYVFISQASFSPKLSEVEKSKMFLQLIFWAQGLGKADIRGESNKAVDAIWRRWGFKPLRTILSFNLDESLDKVVDIMKRGQHGQVVRFDRTNVNDDPVPTEDRRDLGRDVPRGDAQEDSRVPRGANDSAASGVLQDDVQTPRPDALRTEVDDVRKATGS
jgi:hypothetical protein